MKIKKEIVMIDKIYFHIENYSPEIVLESSFDSLKRKVDKSSGLIYDSSLYRLSNCDLVYNKTANSTVVNVNLRKLFYGKDSVKDFENIEDFKKSLIQLSEILKIDYKSLISCSVKTIEIGKNFLINTDCDKVISSIKSYSTLKAKIMDRYVCFQGSICDFKIYDKQNEICSRKSKIDQTVFKEKHKNENYLRIELKLKKKSAVNSKLYGYVENLKDLLSFFDFLPYILEYEIQRLEFSEEQLELLFDFEGKTIKDLHNYLLAIGIQYFGIDNTISSAIKLMGMDSSYHHRKKYKKLASILKMKESNKNRMLLDSFKMQLGISENSLDSVVLASDDFCNEMLSI